MSGLIEWGLFLALSAVAVVTAAGMIITMSMYRAGLALMTSFVALAGLFILLDADLLAAIQVMMNVGGMLVMALFMVMVMIDPGGEMMWDMKRKMHLPGPGAFSMSMPSGSAPSSEPGPQASLPVSDGKGGDGGAAVMPMPATSPAATEDSSTDWTCPMHPEISEPGPGNCPICGMPLVPRSKLEGNTSTSETTPAQKQIYTCPMHPQVREESPGQCPICGMDLVPIQKDEGSANDMHEHGTMNMEVGVAADNTHDMHGMHDTGGMEMGGMAPMNPSQHRQMMVGMAMSTAQLPWALGIGAASALFLVILLARTPWPLAPAGPTGDATSAVGELLLSRYMIAFEGAAFLILAGIAGAVILARREPAPSTQVNMPMSPTLPVPFSEAQIGERQMTEGGERMESEGTIYTCPMHPQVREESPGQCPICGMDLVPVEVGATTAMPARRGGHAIGSGHNKHGEKL